MQSHQEWITVSSNIDFTVTAAGDVGTVATRLREKLEGKGYGILSTIDVQKILKEKNNQSIDPYLILDVCNPRHAGNAMSKHREVGLVLPCKISVYSDEGSTKVSLLKPTEAIGMTGLHDLNNLAGSVEGELEQTIMSVSE